jgi:alcohol dehydrogenase (cytochrome c)
VKTVSNFTRGGFFMQHDRVAFQFIRGDAYSDNINWTKGLDPKTGKPVEYNPNVALQTYLAPVGRIGQDNSGKMMCPNYNNAPLWHTPAYNPQTTSAYVSAGDGCSAIANVVSINKESFNGGLVGKGSGVAGVTKSVADTVKLPPVTGKVWKFNVVTGKVDAQITTPALIRAGVLATAGGLIFTAENDGSVVARDADNLAPLWSFNLGMPMSAPVMTYSYGGKQFFAVIGGGHAGVTGADGQVNSAVVAVFSL